MAINTYLSITIINVNGVKAAITRHMIADWITRMYNHIAYKRPTLGQKTWTDWKWGNGNCISCKWKWQQSDSNIKKKDFKTNIVKADKEGHYIITKGSLIQST